MSGEMKRRKNGTQFGTKRRDAAKAQDKSTRVRMGKNKTCRVMVANLCEHRNAPWSMAARYFAVAVADRGWVSYEAIKTRAERYGVARTTLQRMAREVSNAPGATPRPLDLFVRTADYDPDGSGRTSDLWETSPERLSMIWDRLEELSAPEARKIRMAMRRRVSTKFRDGDGAKLLSLNDKRESMRCDIAAHGPSTEAGACAATSLQGYAVTSMQPPASTPLHEPLNRNLSIGTFQERTTTEGVFDAEEGHPEDQPLTSSLNDEPILGESSQPGPDGNGALTEENVEGLVEPIRTIFAGTIKGAPTRDAVIALLHKLPDLSDVLAIARDAVSRSKRITGQRRDGSDVSVLTLTDFVAAFEERRDRWVKGGRPPFISDKEEAAKARLFGGEAAANRAYREGKVA